MSEKKRKASAAVEIRPKKKQQTSSGSIQIEHVAVPSNIRPVVGSTPGVSFPQDVKFHSFSKSNGKDSQLLLQSSTHPTIDYLAVEGTESTDSHMKHYVAIYDPTANKLQLIEARRMTVRGSIRQAATIEEDPEDEDAAKALETIGTRSALTQAFGSKKSKKAVQAMAENRLLGQGVEGAGIAEAMTAHISDEEDDEEDEAAVLAQARSSKPLPIPNLRTTDIEQVYSLDNLMIQPVSRTHNNIDYALTPWLDRLKASKEINGIRSRFVAHRISYLGRHLLADPSDPKSLQQMQLLYYIEIMIEIAQYITKQSRFSRLDNVSEWPEHTLSAGIPVSTAADIVRHIFPDRSPSDRCMTLLRTTIFALTLHVLPPSGKTGPAQLVVEPTDIQLDLAMEAAEVRKLYHELGCTVKPVGDRELTTWGYSKMAKKGSKKDDGGKAAVKPYFAVLKFPLAFPKTSSGRRMASRR